MIKNRQQMVVNIASQLYSARDSAKLLLKDKYKAEIVKYGGILTGIAKELKIGILEALIKVSKEVEVQGVTTVMLMAAAVELLEPETSIEDLNMIQWLLIGGEGHGKVFPIKGGTSVNYHCENSLNRLEYDARDYLHNERIYRIGVHNPTDSQKAEIPNLIDSTKLSSLTSNIKRG